jgi:hypothetical protein
MFNERLAKIEKAKAELAVAEAKLVADRIASLAMLPSSFGYDDVNVFIKAVKAACGKKRQASRGIPDRKSNPVVTQSIRKGKRLRLTDEIKAQVKALTEAGSTGKQIALATGISLPSVNTIKKMLGLVKPRIPHAVAIAPTSSAAGTQTQQPNL